MGMILNNGAFFAATMEEIRAACQETAESLEALLDKLLGICTTERTEAEDTEGDPTAFPTDPDVLERMKAMCKEEPPAINVNVEFERPFWRGAAAYARKKMAARAQDYARQMKQVKARQEMKRRKLKHADSSFPDWGSGCVR